MSIAASPTRHAGVRFRSRLEARWAAFFDIAGWRWEYEPIDLDGYIPDFILAFDQPLLVEVKPIVWNPRSFDESGAIAKIVKSGWRQMAMVVGATLKDLRCCGFRDDVSSCRIGGRLTREMQEFAALGTTFDAALRFDCILNSGFPVLCRRCPKVLFAPGGGFNDQQYCACNDTDRAALPFDPTPMWREAGNRVQWRSP